jgi:hypothetical protein
MPVVEPGVSLNVIDALRRSAQSASQIIVAYSGGTRAGQERPLIVVSVAEDCTSMVVREPGFDETKVYVLHRILYLVEADGTRVVNEAEMQRHAVYVQDAKASRASSDV